MYTHTDTSNPGATFLSRKTEGTLRALIINLMARHPRASEDRLFALFEKALDEDPGYEQAARLYAFTNFYRYETRRRPELTPNPHTANASAERTAREEEAVKERVASIKSQIVLLALTMPNGKPMHYCTGLEMGQFGEAYERIAKRVGDKTVGEVLNERQVRELING